MEHDARRPARRRQRRRRCGPARLRWPGGADLAVPPGGQVDGDAAVGERRSRARPRRARGATAGRGSGRRARCPAAGSSRVDAVGAVLAAHAGERPLAARAAALGVGHGLRRAGRPPGPRRCPTPRRRPGRTGRRPARSRATRARRSRPTPRSTSRVTTSGGASSATAAGDSASAPLVTIDDAGRRDRASWAPPGRRSASQNVPHVPQPVDRKASSVACSTPRTATCAAPPPRQRAGEVGGRAERAVGARAGHALGGARGRVARRVGRRRARGRRPVLEVHPEVVEGPQDLGVGAQEPHHEHAEEGDDDERSATAMAAAHRSAHDPASGPNVTVDGRAVGERVAEVPGALGRAGTRRCCPARAGPVADDGDVARRDAEA